MIIDLIGAENPEVVKKVHGWFVSKGIIAKDAPSEDVNEIQRNEFLNPKPGSRYFEPDWPKGIVVFVRITTVVMIVLYGLRVIANNSFWTQEGVILVSLA